MTARVLVLVNWYLPGRKSGGPAKTLSNMIDAIGDRFAFRVVTRDRDLGDDQPYGQILYGQWNAVGKADVRYLPSGPASWLTMAHCVLRGDYDVLYLNSLFSVPFAFFPALLGRLTGRPILLGPRGQLAPGALNLKSRQKRAYLLLFRILRLHRAVHWQATTEFERAQIVEVFGPHVRTRIAGNIASRSFVETFPDRQSDTLRLVFLSRVVPMKNLDFALKLLARVSVPVSLDIHGPQEDAGYWALCRDLIDDLPANVTVRVHPAVPGDEVLATLRAYDALLLPTRGENFGHVITEAACAGLPLLISDRTPWRGLSDDGVGWDLPLEESDQYVSCIQALFDMNTDAYTRMRERVLCWAHEKFDSPETRDANVRMLEQTIANVR